MVAPKREYFGSQVPLCEPAWYQGVPSPYYSDDHRQYRAVVRKFVDEEILPNLEKWIADKCYPKELHVKARKAGVLRRPKSLGGTDQFDSFHELIFLDEMARTGGGGVLGQVGINSMALPPIILYGSDYLKKLVVDDVAEGRKHISLAISEPTAGSDVAGIQCKAVKDGDYYVVTGFKKWITGAHMADYLTTAVRTGGKGMGGISLLLIPKDVAGLSIRKMETQFDTCHGTTFLTFDKVRVHKSHLIGRENQGFRYIMYNFNHERFVISVGTCRMARKCYEEAFLYAMQRKAFGKRLIDQQTVRFKLAEVARRIESLHSENEKIAFAFSNGVPDHEMGMICALAKVQASTTFELAAREASQIFGGSSIVKEGKGLLVERLYREVRAVAIPGGSEEVLLDFAMRQAVAKTTAIQKKSSTKL
eukprot:TRINITY_DN801_c0_g4_i1.p1 TRINITY_DN801_c0_g4~~TRINITY_DN801_c0_g4_i1.p1  ORF type:complete len:420 (+),score=96.92 TRINITY_DN801_c0_g4_i1:54-1313(+)